MESKYLLILCKTYALRFVFSHSLQSKTVESSVLEGVYLERKLLPLQKARALSFHGSRACVSAVRVHGLSLC